MREFLAERKVLILGCAAIAIVMIMAVRAPSAKPVAPVTAAPAGQTRQAGGVAAAVTVSQPATVQPSPAAMPLPRPVASLSQSAQPLPTVPSVAEEASASMPRPVPPVALPDTGPVLPPDDTLIPPSPAPKPKELPCKENQSPGLGSSPLHVTALVDLCRPV